MIIIFTGTNLMGVAVHEVCFGLHLIINKYDNLILWHTYSASFDFMFDF